MGFLAELPPGMIDWRGIAHQRVCAASEAGAVRRGDPRRMMGKVVPYGVYDLAADEGWISVGITADTGEFAVASANGWPHHTERRGRPLTPPPWSS